MANARRLAKKDQWKDVFVAPDLTYKERQDANKLEEKLRAEAERRNDEAKNEGRVNGKYVLVGVKGRSRRVEWRGDRSRQEQRQE